MNTWLLLDRERPGSSDICDKNRKKQILLHFLKILRYDNAKKILQYVYTASIT
jgi:hypothetical protein